MKYEITLDLIDEETRFWIAQQVVDTKNTADITRLFRKGKRVAGTKPKTLISDGDRTFIQHSIRSYGHTNFQQYITSTTFDFTSFFRQ
jgi:hypothetical protein